MLRKLGLEREMIKSFIRQNAVEGKHCEKNKRKNVSSHEVGIRSIAQRNLKKKKQKY